MICKKMRSWCNWATTTNIIPTVRWTISISWALLSSGLNLRHFGENKVSFHRTRTSALADARCVGHSESLTCFNSYIASCDHSSWTCYILYIVSWNADDVWFVMWNMFLSILFYSCWILHFAFVRWPRFFNLSMHACNSSFFVVEKTNMMTSEHQQPIRWR